MSGSNVVQIRFKSNQHRMAFPYREAGRARGSGGCVEPTRAWVASRVGTARPLFLTLTSLCPSARRLARRRRQHARRLVLHTRKLGRKTLGGWQRQRRRNSLRVTPSAKSFSANRSSSQQTFPSVCIEHHGCGTESERSHEFAKCARGARREGCGEHV